MKTNKISAIILVILPSVLLIISAFAKFVGAKIIVDNLTKAGVIPYFPLPLLGLLEISCVILYLIPKTWRIGFFLLCGYLGGAGAIEISQHLAPTAFILLVIVWIGAYLRNPELFLTSVKS